jgi:hypothetical protein
MDRKPVTSSTIESVGYDALTAVLEVEFQGGCLYQYFMVPSSVHDGLMKAGSKGRFYGEFVRSRYRYVKH